MFAAKCVSKETLWPKTTPLNCSFRMTPVHGANGTDTSSRASSTVAMNQRERINGWSCPWHPLQFVAWFFLIFFSVFYFGVIVFYLPKHWRAAGFIVSFDLHCRFGSTFVLILFLWAGSIRFCQLVFAISRFLRYFVGVIEDDTKVLVAEELIATLYLAISLIYTLLMVCSLIYCIENHKALLYKLYV